MVVCTLGFDNTHLIAAVVFIGFVLALSRKPPPANAFIPTIPNPASLAFLMAISILKTGGSEFALISSVFKKLYVVNTTSQMPAFTIASIILGRLCVETPINLVLPSFLSCCMTLTIGLKLTISGDNALCI